MQITRQRVRPELTINTAEVCPTCNGTGKVQPTVFLTEDIDRDLDSVLRSRPRGKVFLHVHPYLEAYIKKGFPSKRMKWYMKYQKWVNLVPETEYPITQYKFFDDNEDEVRLS